MLDLLPSPKLRSSMPRYLILLVAALLLLAACGGDDGGNSSPTAPPTASPSLEEQLAAVLLQPEDVPAGLQGSAPIYSTNADIAADEQDLVRIEATGRLLGVDVQYVSTDELDPGSPLRGGIQTSASVYTASGGASATLNDTIAVARANDWPSNYPNLDDVQVAEIDRQIGDESFWLRVSGFGECELTVTPTPDEIGEVPSVTCQGPLVVLDNVIFRSGRVRGFLLVSTIFSHNSDVDVVYIDEVQQWAQVVVERAREAFPQS